MVKVGQEQRILRGLQVGSQEPSDPEVREAIVRRIRAGESVEDLVGTNWGMDALWLGGTTAEKMIAARFLEWSDASLAIEERLKARK